MLGDHAGFCLLFANYLKILLDLMMGSGVALVQEVIPLATSPSFNKNGAQFSYQIVYRFCRESFRTITGGGAGDAKLLTLRPVYFAPATLILVA